MDRGAALMRQFRPDTIIALGGGSPMDAAKVMWLRYEHPEVDFADLKEKFFDVRKRAFRFPTLGELAQLVCIPTTSGTGAEVTPFAVITDPATGIKYPLADYALTPTVAIVDPALTGRMPASLAADSGFDALTHATEAYVSVYANDFTDGMALHAIRLIFANLEAVRDRRAGRRRRRASACTTPGRSPGWRSATRSSGSCTRWPTPSASTFHLVHGRTNATLLPHVIRYNGTVPTKLTSWPKYEHYVAPGAVPADRGDARPAGRDPGRGRGVLRGGGRAAARRGRHPGVVRGAGRPRARQFLGRLDELAMRAYEDQCAPGEPAHADARRHGGPHGGRLPRHSRLAEVRARRAAASPAA